MNDPLHIEQAVFTPKPAANVPRLLHSPGFRHDWEPELDRIAAGFGEPPPGVRCPSATFACPFADGRVAVCRATDQEGPLRFHLLILDRELYGYLGDPFLIADRFPAPWAERRELPAVRWPEEPPPPRTVGRLQRVLKNGDSPLLLGATQVIVDDGRICLHRDGPEEKLVRDVWSLLPHQSRAEAFPASFAFSAELGFHLLVTPPAAAPEDPSYLGEEQALDYPESRYERNLQIAIEGGDQAALDRLLSRRSSKQTLKLAIGLVIFFAVVSIAMRVLAVHG